MVAKARKAQKAKKAQKVQKARKAPKGGDRPAALAESAAATFTVHKGRRYRATVVLSGFEQLASNQQVAGKFTDLGFTDVTVTGSGKTRHGEGTWSGPDTTVELDPHLTDVAELPAVG
jgi:hypothetical protein